MGKRRSMRLPGRQRGLALLVLVTLFTLSGAYLLVSTLYKSSAALSLTRASTDRAALLEAKTALVSWATAEASQPTSGQGFQPGALPCPDRNNDGIAESSCSTSGVNQLGRLPYKTLGISPLRDTSGEILWYALSANFSRNSVNVINGDKQGTLSITGQPPASNVIAIVIAPGRPLANQDRSPGGTACNNSSQACNNAINYLEDINSSDASYDTYISLTDPALADQFNDQLLAISHQDLFSQVEPAVAARIQRDIVLQYIYSPSPGTSTSWADAGGTDKSRYFDAWGAFPFAATFADPGSSSFTGQASTYEGLLPMADLSPDPVLSPRYLWGSGSVTQTGGSGVVWAGSSCSTVFSNSRVQCGIWYYYAPTFRMSGTVDKVGRSFVQLPRLSDVSISGSSMSSRSMSGSLNSAGVGTVRLDATLSWRSDWTYATVTIKNDNLLVSALTSTTGSDIAGWFNNNQWYKQVYYAVSPGYAPGGGGSCNAVSPRCLSVAGLPAPYANPTTDTRAVLILAGRSLNGSARPSASVTDYVEAQNAITAQNMVTGNYAFQHESSKAVPVTINDRVIVVAP